MATSGPESRIDVSGSTPNEAASSETRPEAPATGSKTVNDAGRSSNEHSPLLSDDDEDLDEDDYIAHGDDIRTPLHDEDGSQATKSIWYLVMLTLAIGGLQIAWSVELSNGSPYLLSLGLSKSLMALVWIAGPLTGTLVQPYIGMLSDNCRLPWGKRKPFMAGGAVATAVSLIFLAWTKEIVVGVLGLFGADASSNGVKVVTIVVAVIGIYVLDFAINTVQAAIRAFIVDCAPAHQQEAANAMASRLIGVGSIIGFIAGYTNLPASFLSFLGDTQFKILCVLASAALLLTVGLSTSIVRERDPRLDVAPIRRNPNLITFFSSIFRSIKRLPPQTWRVCQVEFCSWVGFFPLLFYSSSYIGEIYVQPFLEENPNMTPAELDQLYERATRVGTFALLINAIISLSTNVLLPFFIAPTYDTRPVLGDGQERPQRSVLDRLRIPGLTLKRAWLGSLVLFAVVMFSALFVRSVAGATAIVGLAGITWAVTLWAPWAIISAEVSRRDAIARSQKLRTTRRSTAAGPPSSNLAAINVSSSHDDDDMGMEEGKEEVDQAGVIMGIHNMSIAAPQIIATFASSLIFKIWQKPRGTPGDHSIAFVMAMGGICVLASTYFAFKIGDGDTDEAPALQPHHLDEEQGFLERAAEGGGNTRPVARGKSGYAQVPGQVEDDGPS